MQVFVLLGAPGSGKGTVSQDLTKAADVCHVSTGDVLRAAVKEGTPVGRTAAPFMENGELVPDDIIIGIVDEFLDQAGEARFLFDGFPRTEHQAKMLDVALTKRGTTVDRVFLLEVPEEVLINRLSGRRICKSCGAVFHVINIPPRVAGVCDTCGGDLYQRTDDNEETVRNRLSVFRAQTQTLIDYYEQQGLLMRVKADGGRLATQQAILAAL